MCYVASDYNAASRSAAPASEYLLPDGRAVTLTAECFRCTDSRPVLIFGYLLTIETSNNTFLTATTAAFWLFVICLCCRLEFSCSRLACFKRQGGSLLCLANRTGVLLIKILPSIKKIFHEGMFLPLSIDSFLRSSLCVSLLALSITIPTS